MPRRTRPCRKSSGTFSPHAQEGEMTSTSVTAVIRAVALTVVVAAALSACHLGGASEAKQSGGHQRAGSAPSTPAQSPDDKLGRLRTSDLSSSSTLKALYPGSVRLSLASNPNAGSTNANCASDV